MATKIKLRRNTTTYWNTNNPTLDDGEPCIGFNGSGLADTLKIGPGAWNDLENLIAPDTGGGYTQEQIQDIVGAMFPQGIYDDEEGEVEFDFSAGENPVWSTATFGTTTTLDLQNLNNPGVYFEADDEETIIALSNVKTGLDTKIKVEVQIKFDGITDLYVTFPSDFYEEGILITDPITLTAPIDTIQTYQLLKRGDDWEFFRGGSGTGTTLTPSVLGVLVNSADAKATPVDADVMPIADSAASWIVRKLSWANIKATLKSYFDNLYQSVLVSGTNIKTINGSSILGPGDLSVSGGGGGGGEVNTASNVGTGEGDIYKEKVGSDIRLKTLKQGPGITITNNPDDVTISATAQAATQTEVNTGSNTAKFVNASTLAGAISSVSDIPFSSNLNVDFLNRYKSSWTTTATGNTTLNPSNLRDGSEHDFVVTFSGAGTVFSTFTLGTAGGTLTHRRLDGTVITFLSTAGIDGGKKAFACKRIGNDVFWVGLT